MGDLRALKARRTVLVRADDGGVWTGHLAAWEQIDGQWYGHATWTGYTASSSGVLPAQRLRPFEERWVEARPGITPQEWRPGRLIGLRRRPGAEWEGHFEPVNDGSRPIPSWVAMTYVRDLDQVPAGGFGEAPF